VQSRANPLTYRQGVDASLTCCKNDDCTILHYCDNTKVGKHELFAALHFHVNFIKLCVLKTIQKENQNITDYNMTSKPQPPIKHASEKNLLLSKTCNLNPHLVLSIFT